MKIPLNGSIWDSPKENWSTIHSLWESTAFGRILLPPSPWPCTDASQTSLEEAPRLNSQNMSFFMLLMHIHGCLNNSTETSISSLLEED